MIKLHKRVISFAASLTMLTSVFAGISPLSVSAENAELLDGEKLVYSQDFSDESTVEVETRLESSPAADLKEEDISKEIVDGALKLTKLTAPPSSSGTSENYSNLIKFGNNVVEKTDYTETYLKEYKGEYIIKADIVLSAGTSKQMIGAAPYTMSGGSSRASSPFVIHPTSGFGYYHWRSAADGGTLSAYLSDKQGTRRVYAVDTQKGEVTASIDGTDETISYSFISVPGSDDYTINGLRIGMKPAHAVGESVTIDNIEVYQKTLAAAQQAVVDAAATVNVDQNIDGASVALAGTVDGGTVNWTSSNDGVINASNGTVTQTDAAQDVTLTAEITVGDAVAYKEFNVTVAAGSEQPAETVAYHFDAADVTAFAADDIGKYGFVQTSASWGPGIVENALGTLKTVRFTIKESPTARTRWMTHTYAQDTINNPQGIVAGGDTITYEAELIPIAYNKGYSALVLMDDATEFAEIRFSHNDQKAYLVGSDGKKIGNDVTIKLNSNAEVNQLIYVKVAIDVKNQTYSAWAVPRKTGTGAYTEIPASSEYLLAENQKLNAAVSKLTGIAYDLEGSGNSSGLQLRNEKVSVTSSGEPEVTPEAILARAKAYVDNLKLAVNYNDITGDLRNMETSWTDTVSGQPVSISWKSSNISAIGDDGKYLAGAQPAADISVTMTATISLAGETQTATSEHKLTIKKYGTERLVYETSFQDLKGKFDANGEIAGVVEKVFTGSYEKSELSNSVDANGLTVSKTTDANTEDNGERLVEYVYLKNVVDQDNNTTTYLSGFQGQYRVEMEVSNALQGSQASVISISGGNNVKMIDTMIKNDALVYYAGSGSFPEIGSNPIKVFSFDTDKGTISANVKGGTGADYEKTFTGGDTFAMNAIMVAMKPSAGKNNKIIIKNVKVYELKNTMGDVEALKDAASLLTMNAITSTPDAVSDSVNLPTTIDGAESATVSWKSSNEEIIDLEGNVIKPNDAATKVVLSANIKIGSSIICKDFTVTVPKEDNPQKLVQLDQEWLKIENLLGENKTENSISKNLNLIAKGKYGSAITWVSNNTEYISNDGKIQKLGLNAVPYVTMTATIKNGDVTLTKDFLFKLAIDYNNPAAEMVTLNTIDTSKDKLDDTIVQHVGIGKIYIKDGAVHLDRTANSAQDGNISSSSQERTAINVRPAHAGIVIPWQHRVVADVELTIPTAKAKFELLPMDHLISDGEDVNSTGGRAATIYSGLDAKGPYFKYVTGDVSHQAVYFDPEYNAEKDINKAYTFKFHFDIDIDNQTVAISYSVNGGEMISLLGAKKQQAMPVREAVSEIADFAVRAADNSNDDLANKFDTTVKNVTLKGNKAYLFDSLTQAVDYTGNVEALNGNVFNDITLPTENFGNYVTVNWISSNPNILTNDGKVLYENLTEDTSVTLAFKLSQTDDPSVFIEKSFPLTVRYKKLGNLAVKAEVENAVSLGGHGPEKAIDGYMDSYWQTMRSENTPALIVNFGSDTTGKGKYQEAAFNQIVIDEAAISDAYNIRGYVIEVSSDDAYKKTWKTIATGGALGGETVVIDVPIQTAKFVRFRVTDKVDKTNSGLKEFQILLTGEGDVQVKAALALLVKQLGSLKNLTKDIELPETGQNGCSFTYSSNKPNSLSNTGEVTREQSTVSGTLTITAELNGEPAKQDVPFSVLGTGGGGNGGGSSSGNHSSSGNNSGTVVPSFPTGNTTPEEVVFPDVDSSYWAYNQIKVLKEKNIINGDANGRFNPENFVTREEFVKMLLGAFGISITTTAKANFTDIAENDWCSPYVAKAVELGIVNGISDTEFGKGMTITREDMAVMCARAMAAAGKTVQSGTISFTDNDQIADYAAESVGAMQAMGIINGYGDDNSFRPKNNAKRSEAAKIIYMIVK